MDSNRLRISCVRETALGVLPGSMRMRTGRITREALSYAPVFATPNEIRADRMNADPTKINERNEGPIDFEWTYPTDNTFLSEVIRSVMFNGWTNTPQHDNDGTADSVITGTTAATGTFTVVDQSGSGGFAGSAYKVGHLLRTTGFQDAGNNGLFRCTGSTSTTALVGSGQGVVDQAAPAAAARLKVVGFQGASADITATASGLASTALDFTTLGLSVGQWLKIGGTGAAFSFASVAANNAWVRVASIAANALGLDNLPTGWGVDAGTAKTIRVFFGDTLRNGVNAGRTSLAIERSFLAQATPTHIFQQGMVANTLSLTFAHEQMITGSVGFMGVSGAQGTVANGTSYDAATTSQVMTANASVGRIAEAGVVVGTPNWIRSATINMTNNLRMIGGVGKVGAFEIGLGEIGITGRVESYFGSNAFLAKLLAGTVTNLNFRAAINGQATVLGLPRVTFTGGSPNAGGKNQDVILPLDFTTSYDAVTGAEIIVDRLEYFE